MEDEEMGVITFMGIKDGDEPLTREPISASVEVTLIASK